MLHTPKGRARGTGLAVAAALLLVLALAAVAGSSGLAADNLMPDAEIAAATFVDLDFSKYPKLPPNQVPQVGAIFVSPQGSDGGAGTMQLPFRTVAHAVHLANPGSTIVVRQGNYTEAWEPGDYRALVLRQDNLTVMAYPGETVLIKPATGVTYGVVVNARNLVLRGINLQGFSTVGVLFESGSTKNQQIVIADLEIKGSAESVAMWDAASAVDELLLANVQTDSIIHCGVGPCSSWRLENVTIDAKGTGWGADAFAIESGDNVLIVDMTVLGAGSDGIDTKATRVVVLDSRIEGVQNNALKLWHGGDVINTRIKRGGLNPIVVEEGRFRLLNSTISFPSELAGLRDYSMILGHDKRLPMQIEIVNSIVANPSSGAWINRESSWISIRNTLFYTADGSETLMHGNFEATYSDGASGINQSYGSANLTADPMLDGDLRPVASSPAIDAGVVLSQDFPARDREGKNRVYGAAPDLGAFEFGGAPSTIATGPGTSPTGQPGVQPPSPPPTWPTQSPPSPSQPGPMTQVPSVAAAAIGATFSEDFGGPLDSSWQFIGSGMQIQGQRLTCTRGPQDSPTGAGWYTPQMAAYTMSLDYTHGSGIGAVALNYSDPGSHYRVWFINDQVQVLRRGVGSTELAVEERVAYPLAYGQTYTVTLTVDSGHIRVALNGQQVLHWIDPQPLPPGALVFGCGTGTGFAFDNITLASSVPAGPPSEAKQAEKGIKNLLEGALYGLAGEALKKALPEQKQEGSPAAQLPPGQPTLQVPQSGAWSQSVAEGLEFGTNRFGGDYTEAHLQSADPQLCRQACIADSKCKAFTYVNPGIQGSAAKCWLKNTVPPPEPNGCCVSGVKSGS